MAYSVPRYAVSESNAVQQGTVCKGVVKDATGETVIGATVVVKGTTNGTVTGIDGDFQLSNVERGAVIQISFIGYQTVEVTWQGTPLQVTLKDDTQALDEVVVVGYGTQKKVNVTGAVGMVDSKVLAARPVTNVSQALQGTVPGLNFTVGSEGGALDGSMSFNIRGTGTIGDGSGSSPLVLIDGIEGSLNSLNPNDVESVSVLKDAASASIYGARAAFGVILVQTKKGKAGKARVNYGVNVRFSDAVSVPEMMDSYTFARYFNRAAENVGAAAVFSADALQRIQDYQAGKLTTVCTINENTGRWNNYGGANANTDWFKEFYDDWVPSQEHNVSISGGSEKIQYTLSGSFLDQNGLLRHGDDNLQRYTVNSNITANVTDWFKVSYSTKWTRENFERPSYLTGLFFHNIARRWPTCPAYDPNGYPMDGMEILQLEDGGKQRNEKDLNTQQLQLIFEPIKNWTIHLEGALRTNNTRQHWEVLPIYAHDVAGNPFAVSWDGGGSYAAGASRVNEYSYKENYYSTNIYTDYFKQFDSGHYFKVMVGFNSELYKTANLTGQKNTLISNSVPTLNTATESPTTSGGYAHNGVAGFFGRINYSYKDRYMVEVNGRYDGSSRFIGDKRWGFFPSFSLGWNIAREDFFAGIAEKARIDMLKLRGSWGQLGNTNTNDAWYPFYQTMPQGSNYNWLVNGVRPNYASLPGIVSSLKTWETIETWDIGLDWAFFNNRLTGSFDYFVRWTYDMIGPAPELPSILGATPPKINNADMKSYGFEFELGWRDQIGDFSYGAKFTLADDQQKITSYPNENLKLSEAYYPGMMLGEIWGYETVGIAQTQEEMDAHLAKVDQSSLGSKWGAGDIMYADLDGNGVISNADNTRDNPGDRKIIGNKTPRFKYGVTLDAAWKGIDFRIFFQGVAKRDYWMNGPYFWGANGTGEWQAAGFVEHWDFWRPEGDPLGANTDAYYPRVLKNDSRNMKVQSRYLQNAAYCRIKNLQVGYTLPKAWTDKAGMSSVRVYISGDNLFTFSHMSKIFDPEALESTYDANNGKLYPLQRTISVGLNVNF
ncbi:SusC/RagA family TonB-linked outer membrane protein [uncultured Mediterranea sp.]|uniref:SusC/RagA family TonB-linked outer membrane protein n=1 Tax=uncultured Mediterranea sp. TaxID=1926662 RepID=UPI0035A73974